MEITLTYYFLLSFFSLEEIVCVEIEKLKYFKKVLFLFIFCFFLLCRKYNNFFEGEFVLYRHTTMPYEVYTQP